MTLQNIGLLSLMLISLAGAIFVIIKATIMMHTANKAPNDSLKKMEQKMAAGFLIIYFSVMALIIVLVLLIQKS